MPRNFPIFSAPSCSYTFMVSRVPMLPVAFRESSIVRSFWSRALTMEGTQDASDQRFPLTAQLRVLLAPAWRNARPCALMRPYHVISHGAGPSISNALTGAIRAERSPQSPRTTRPEEPVSPPWNAR